VLDPVVLVYAGYIGGTSFDQANGIAVDSAGHAYIAGVTASTQATFPVTVGPDLTANGTCDAFVAKVRPNGSGLVYAGFIGGGGVDIGRAIAVDSAGSAYVIGTTTSTQATFPVRVGPDLTCNGATDAFVAQISPSNLPPVANAGPDQTVHVGTVVTLDGSDSADPDGGELTFAWTMQSAPSGSTATLSNPAAVMPTFTPDRLGDYVIELVVTDVEGAVSAPDTVIISTFNAAPVAEAGSDQLIIVIGTTVCLDGSQSFDPDGDPIAFQWSFDAVPAGSTAFLSGADTDTPCFVADVHGDYRLRLVVTDSFGASSAPDTVMVGFTNIKPVADAGTGGSVLVGETVPLDGSDSADANGDPLTFRWTFGSVPAGSLAAIADPGAAVTSFVPDVTGTYLVQLVVNDGFVDSDPATLQIEAVRLLTQVLQDLQTLQSTIAALSPWVFKHANMQKTLVNKLNAVMGNIEAGAYQDALGQLAHDILGKTDGCASAGMPDPNDWVKDCAVQQVLYPALLDSIDQVRVLCGC